MLCIYFHNLLSLQVSNLPRNHGLLYACALRDMFSCCSDSVDIDFEERKYVILIYISAINR